MCLTPLAQTQRNRVIDILFEVIDDLNERLPMERQIPKYTDTPLFGTTGSMDSLGLVHLIVATEEQLEEEFGMAISIADERAIQSAPFGTVKTLASYISLLLNERADETRQQKCC